MQVLPRKLKSRRANFHLRACVDVCSCQLAGWPTMRFSDSASCGPVLTSMVTAACCCSASSTGYTFLAKGPPWRRTSAWVGSQPVIFLATCMLASSMNSSTSQLASAVW